MKLHFKLLLSIFFVIIQATGFCQLQVLVSIENEQLIGSDYFFEIYLKKVSNGSSDVIFLGNADFFMNFNSSNFDNPEVAKVGTSSEFCSFKPTISSPANDNITRFLYHNYTTIEVMDSLISINLNSFQIGNQEEFDAHIAKIDEASQMHRLGRFKITGAMFDDAKIIWKEKGIGLNTKVLTYENNGNFMTYQIPIQTCQYQLVITDVPMLEPIYQASGKIISLGQIHSGSDISLNAGQSIELGPLFSVAINGTLEIDIHGCQ